MAMQAGGTEGPRTTETSLTALLARIARAQDLVGRLRTESALQIASGYAAYADDTDRWSQRVSNGGSVAYQAVTGEYKITLTGMSGSTAVHIHNHTAHYRPDHEMAAVLSGRFTAAAGANQRIEIAVTSGVASSDTALQSADTIGFYYEAGEFGVFYRSSIAGGPDQSIPQASWNIDKLDGFGVSGYHLTAAQLLNINYFRPAFVWLGAFGIAWYVGEHLVHFVPFSEVEHAIAQPFMRNPHMRLCVYARNAGASIANDFHYNCGSIETAGGGTQDARPFFTDRHTGVVIGGGVAYPLLSMQPAATFGGIVNGRRLVPEEVGLRAQTQAFWLKVWYGVIGVDLVLTGSSFGAPANNNGTCAEVDIAATAVTINAGARAANSVYVPSGTAGSANLTTYFGDVLRSLSVRGDGTRTGIVIVGENTAGGGGTASIERFRWKDLG